MSATISLQQAVVSQLSVVDQLSRVFHDAPARATYPYVVLNCSDERDWSFKGRQGREITLQLVIWDDQPSRLLTLEAEIEQRLQPLSLHGSWLLSSLVLTGKERTRDPSGPWSCMFEHRARLFAVESEVGE